MRLLRYVFLGMMLFMLSQCATLMGERTVRMSAAQIQQKLNQKLEKPWTVMKVLHVQLSNAVVTLDPATNRVHTTMEASIDSNLLANTVTGRTSLSGILKFDAARSAVILDQPTVDSVQLDGAHSEWSGMLQQLAKDVGSKWLDQMVLYQVKPEELTYAGVHYQPTELKVTPNEVQVTLQPQ